MTEECPPPEGSGRQAAAPPAGRRRWRGWAGGGAALLLALLVGLVLWYVRYPDQPGPARSAVATVEIPPRVGLSGIKGLLVGAGVISDDPRFILLAKQMGVARGLKAGEYAFAPGATPRSVLRDLAAGKTVLHAITLAEGLNRLQTADLIRESGWGGREEFLRLVSDPGLIKGFGLEVATLEGYLFPDTYLFAKGTGLQSMITTMVRRMLLVVDQEMAKSPPPGSTRQAGGGGPPLTRHQILTLASIIEKETALATERPLVAEVFLNRLRTGMKLQADPTVVYGLAKFDSPLTKDDLASPTPYNTYVNPGLPAGPICNPGRTAIAAVLHPADQEYYYFVSQNDGSHYFSRSLAEHNRAVARYRKKRLSNRE